MTPEPVDDDGLHVVFGAGQVGTALIEALARSGLAVRAVSQRRPGHLPDGVGWRTADLSDPDAATDAAKGARVIYQCLGAPYTKWPTLFPPLQRAVLAAAERTGALLVTLENVYGYGPTGGIPMTESHALAATTQKGRVRADMTRELLARSEAGDVRIAIGRASDFFGPGATLSALGERVFAKALAGKPVDFLGNADLLHTYSYVPDIATGLVTLGTDERAVGEVWHLPGPETVTTSELLELIADQVGHPVTARSMPKTLLWAVALVNPMMRGLAEMAYQFEEPFVLDTAKYESTFGTASTPLATALADTLAWYRVRSATP